MNNNECVVCDSIVNKEYLLTIIVLGIKDLEIDICEDCIDEYNLVNINKDELDNDLFKDITKEERKLLNDGEENIYYCNDLERLIDKIKENYTNKVFYNSQVLKKLNDIKKWKDK